MRTYLDCAPCFMKQALEAARRATSDEALHQEVVRRTARELALLDMTATPPFMAQKIHRIVRELTGNLDPYREVKERTNRLALGLLPAVRRRVRNAGAPLEMAVRMAVAGNIIDFGLERRFREEDVEDVLERAAVSPLHGGFEGFEQDAARASSILYLADNSGEIVFDRVLIEALGPHRVTVAVRGRPVLNDALREDAIAAGLTDVELVDNGSDAPGTILEDCSDQLRERFAAADMVIAKGQGNYETLSGAHRPVWFVLMAKCPVIARHIGCEPGSFVLQKR
ncbi:MAG: ARMT1-like domain-containing protein [Thermoanaerobaculales bacterium]|jgi:uncharacterized protein with ATP-grasp and redox domains|nr:ARMT1-like domain-containing protein [Thermoanaerobaculales bacterium]